jgi:hypothetical protein
LPSTLSATAAKERSTVDALELAIEEIVDSI